jgi:WD40 repeat protein
MSAARNMAAAALLHDGRVLVVGGMSSGTNALASAEVYDPKSGAFSPTGSMTTPRSYASVTLLPDGRVLVVGGEDANANVLASAEIYDPRTGTFSGTGPMGVPRVGQTATLLPDGRVLVAGGVAALDGNALASAELYDPRTGSFSPTGSMVEARYFATATRLSDGRVLLVGGMPAMNLSANALESAEIYDPQTGTFTPTGSMVTPRVGHSATLLEDGGVLAADGLTSLANSGAATASAEVYDPQTGRFTEVASTSAPRVEATATLLPDGRVLIAGGAHSLSTNAIALAELLH